MTLTIEDMCEIIGRCRFNEWRLVVRQDKLFANIAFGALVAGRPYLQVRGKSSCNVTGITGQEWSGRKWFLSPHMTPSELVATAFKAVMTAVEHETREQFKYRGRSIFDPHYDVDQLHALRGAEGCLDVRADGMEGA